MKRDTLTLQKPVDPAKIAQSLQIGFRFIDRKKRYILQAYVRMGEPSDHTWVDIPLVPEIYGGQA